MSGIVRVVKTPERYTITDNEIINNSAMTWEARAVLIYLLSKPDNWTVRVNDLVNQSPAGIKIVRRIIKELESFKYLYRYKYQGEGGKWAWESVVFDQPQLTPPQVGGTLEGVAPYSPKGKTVKPSTPNGKTVTVRPSGPDIVTTEKQITTTATKDQKKVYDLWASNIEPIAPLTADKLDLDLEDFGYEWVEYAINECVDKGVRNYAYFKGILQRMKTDGGKRDKPAAKPRSQAPTKRNGGNAPVFQPDIFQAIQDQVARATGD